MSLDFDLASIQVAKSSFDVPQRFKHPFSLSVPRFKVLGEIRVGRIQELDVISFVQVQDELADVLEAHLRPAFEKGNNLSSRIRFVSRIHSPSDATSGESAASPSRAFKARSQTRGFDP
jgi:hypothetical protein